MKHNSNRIVLFWFRRDLRLSDNVGLSKALISNLPVLPIFIFDTVITNELPDDDPRISFIYDNIKTINEELKKHNSGLYCLKGQLETTWEKLIDQFAIAAVYTNEDYEPYAIKRDAKIAALLAKKDIPFYKFKDQVIFAKTEVVKNDNTPYTVYTSYKNKWLTKFSTIESKHNPVNSWGNYLKIDLDLPDLQYFGFKRSSIKVLPYRIDSLDNYETTRNIPGLDNTSKLSPHLRFGTVSVRSIVLKIRSNHTFLNEMIWREFFMQILYNFPKVVNHNFKSKYNGIRWRNNNEEFDKWTKGKTGYPIVDAGMRELNLTGYMQNRIRMITAGFLCKHLLVDWRWGESYFADKLLDYELSSNNGNWQWAAGTGCDAAPYFRIFNPAEQIKKFDPDMNYVKKWIPEFHSREYPKPIVEHKFARERAINTYKAGLNLYD
jgi:deoxyribodipyrimidine photo-lyase